MSVARIVELFQAGGLVMYPLLACSLFVVAITLERHWNYEKAESFRSHKEAVLRSLRNKERLIVREDAGPIGELLQEAYAWQDVGGDVQLQLYENNATFVMARFKERLNYLETVVTLAPLLGLLGTVLGMIQSFQVLSVKTGQMQTITGGVGEALVATATGLCVAVLALLCHVWLGQRVDCLAGDLEECGNALLQASVIKTGRAGRGTA